MKQKDVRGAQYVQEFHIFFWIKLYRNSKKIETNIEYLFEYGCCL
jgi:hypothetical protein